MDSFTYDGADQLLGASVDGIDYSYTYTGDGRRLSADADGVTTSFAWDPNARLPLLATESDGSGASLRDYTYGLSLTPLSLTSGGVSSYLSTDALGSVLATSSASGAVQGASTYLPFGSTLIAATTAAAPARNRG